MASKDKVRERSQLLAELRKKHPHLKEEIEKAKNAIFHAHSLVKRRNPEKARHEIGYMAKSGLLPSQIARHFLETLVNPWEAGAAGSDINTETPAEAARQAGEGNNANEADKPGSKSVEFRAFWKPVRKGREIKNVKVYLAASPKKEDAVSDVIFVSGSPWARFRHEKGKGYLLGTTPFRISLAEGKYTFRAVLEGEGTYGKERTIKHSITIGKRSKYVNFLFEIIGGATGGDVKVTTEPLDINIDVNVPSPTPPQPPPSPTPPPKPILPPPSPKPPPGDYNVRFFYEPPNACSTIRYILVDGETSMNHGQQMQVNQGHVLRLEARGSGFQKFEIIENTQRGTVEKERKSPTVLIINAQQTDIIAHYTETEKKTGYFPAERPLERPIGGRSSTRVFRIPLIKRLFGGPSLRTAEATPHGLRLTRERRILAARASRFYRNRAPEFRQRRQRLKALRALIDRRRRTVQGLLNQAGRRQDSATIRGVIKSENPTGAIQDVVQNIAATGLAAKLHQRITQELQRLENSINRYNDYRAESERIIREEFPRDLKADLEAHVQGITAGMRTTSDEIQRARDILNAYVNELVEHYRKRAMGEAWRGIKELGAFGSTALGGETRTRDFLGMITKDWWGVWLWPLLNFFIPPLGWIVLIIWALLKIPIASSVIVLWLQVAFLVGGTVLGLASLPGYTAAATLTQLLVLGFIGGMLNWLLNIKTNVSVGPLFEGTPFGAVIQQFSHIVGGAMIFIGVGIFTMALQLGLPSIAGIAVMAGIVLLFAFLLPPEYLSMLIIIFVVFSAFPIFGGIFGGAATAVYGIFVIMGMTNFYPMSGLGGMNVLALAVLVFGYLAIGPYSAFMLETMSQIKAPVAFAVSYAKLAFSDVWLLLTNPTEYYEQQQLRKVQAERPLSFPQGVEVTRLDIIPDGTVAAGQPFVAFVVVENKGDQVAKNVVVRAQCSPGTPASAKCDVMKDSKPTIIDGKNLGDLEPLDSKLVEFEFVANHRSDTYGSGQSRLGETVFNHVNISLAYSYSTASRLQVETANQAEIRRRQLSSEPVFVPVPAVGKVGPAQLSVYVGPQPLLYESQQEKEYIVAAVSNTRPDAEIIVWKTKGIAQGWWNITLSEGLGSNLKCSSACKPIAEHNSRAVQCTFDRGDTQESREQAETESRSADDSRSEREFANAGDAIGYLMYLGNQPGQETGNYHVIRSHEFEDYWVQVCTFEPADPASGQDDREAVSEPQSKTGIITSTLEDYIVRMNKEKSVKVGPPLGIIGEEVRDEGAAPAAQQQGNGFGGGGGF